MEDKYKHTREGKVLEVSNLGLFLGGRTILREVNISVDNIVRPGMNQGQVVALLGPSGIGKTQLFRCLAGLQKPTLGTIYVTKELIPVEAGMVGVVAQTYPLFKHRTVLGNLIVAGKQRGYSKKEAEERAMDLLSHYGLADRKDFYPSKLSGGQRQRVAILQQVLSSEHFLLMDEPFSGLDTIAKSTACDTILQLSKLDELNTTIVVTHDIESAVKIADTVWLMGRMYDEQHVLLGASIVKKYNLIERGLAWHENIQEMPEFHQMVNEIKNDFYRC